MPTSISREGLTLDSVFRLLRKTVLNHYLTLPLAAALTYLQKNPELIPRDLPPNLTKLTNPKTLAAILKWLIRAGIAGFTLSANEFLNKWTANNWARNRRGEWTDWSKEIVVVTGASSGIGENIVKGLLERDPRTTVVIIDFSPLGWEVPEAWRTNVHYYQADLSDPAVVKEVSRRVREEVGHPTVLVNNAGLARGYNVLEGSYADVEITMKTNLIAPFLLCKEFLPEMARRDHGHIVNICSMSAFLPPPLIGDYAASKAGVQMLHEALQLELKYDHKAPHVRLTLACPSFIKTPLLRGRTDQSQFVMPLLHVRSVSEEIVGALYSGYGKTFFLPGIMRYISMLRGGPEWMLRLARAETVKIPVEFRGRQKVDEKGRLIE